MAYAAQALIDNTCFPKYSINLTVDIDTFVYTFECHTLYLLFLASIGQLTQNVWES